MYDHLSAEPPAPPPGALDAVHARARFLQRRRWFATGGGTAAVAAVVVTAVVLSSGPGPERSSLVVADEPSATATQEVTPWPVESSPVPQPNRPTASPSPVPVTEPTATTSPSPSCGEPFSSCPDGRPGWFSGFGGCQNAAASDLPAGTSDATLLDGVTALLTVPDVRSGGEGKATVEVTNYRDDRVHLDLLLQPQLQAVVVGGAQHGTDALQPPRPYDLDPGTSVVLELPVLARSCGDTAEDREPALARGSYVAGLTLVFDNARTGSADSPEPSPSPSPTRTEGQVGLQVPFEIS